MTLFTNLRKRAGIAVACAAIGFLVTPAESQAIVIGPGEIMEATFSMAGPPVPQPGWTAPPDVVGVIFNAPYVSGFGPPVVRVEVFDGATRLADFELDFSYPFTLFALTAPESSFTFRATDIDFSSFRDGTIDGRFRVTNISQAVPGFGRPAPAFDASFAFQGIGTGTGTNGFVTFGNVPVIDTQRKVTVPEPGIMALTACAMIGLARRRRVSA